ncbi:MAG: quinol:electron acceptor oxidoreductase subunit ActD [Planctomycetota bacterium]
MVEENTNEQDSQLVGLLAQFDDPDSLIAACNQAREAGYKKMDAYTPFPVHGIDPAIGIKRSILPFIVLAVGIGAAFVGIGLQFFANSNYFDGLSPFPGYGFNIGGKPIFSTPANIPVTFEIIVLSSAFAAFFGMWGLNKLPMFSNPLHRISRFKRATNDKFFLMIEEADGQFEYATTEGQLNEWGAVAIEECRQDLTDTKLPRWLTVAGVMVAILLLLPPVMIFRAKGMTERAPRLHFNPDMDWQIKFKSQTVGPVNNEGEPLFEDMRAMRDQVPGTIAFGDLEADSEMFEGIKSDWKPEVTVTTATGSVRTSLGENQEAGGVSAADDLTKYVTSFPEGIEVNEEFLARGQQRFNIYCSACHGYDGNGNGLVNKRAMALNAAGEAGMGTRWTTAKSLHDATVKDSKQNPLGRIFETITHGRNTMGPYGAQITPKDRWAIVAYVKAVQETELKLKSDQEADDSDDSSDNSSEDDSANPRP